MSANMLPGHALILKRHEHSYHSYLVVHGILQLR